MIQNNSIIRYTAKEENTKKFNIIIIKQVRTIELGLIFVVANNNR